MFVVVLAETYDAGGVRVRRQTGRPRDHARVRPGLVHHHPRVRRRPAEDSAIGCVLGATGGGLLLVLGARSLPRAAARTAGGLRVPAPGGSTGLLAATGVPRALTDHHNGELWGSRFRGSASSWPRTPRR